MLPAIHTAHWHSSTIPSTGPGSGLIAPQSPAGSFPAGNVSLHFSSDGRQVALTAGSPPNGRVPSLVLTLTAEQGHYVYIPRKGQD